MGLGLGSNASGTPTWLPLNPVGCSELLLREASSTLPAACKRFWLADWRLWSSGWVLALIINRASLACSRAQLATRWVQPKENTVSPCPAQSIHCASQRTVATGQEHLPWKNWAKAIAKAACVPGLTSDPPSLQGSICLPGSKLASLNPFQSALHCALHLVGI